MNGTCPSCKQLITNLRGGGADVTFPQGNAFKTITLNCPFCNAILGAQIDPIALRTDIVNMTADRVIRALRG